MDIPHDAVIDAQGLDALLRELGRRGYCVVGPTIREGAIVYDEIESVAELPKGWTDEQEAGRYRLVPRRDDALFGYAVGPQSWKRLLHPPRLPLWRGRRDGGAVDLAPAGDPPRPYAFIGVRACELAAIAIQDRVFLGGPHKDRHYGARREGAFLVAVNCSTAGGTCFCVSMGTGPKAETGFDLALTELPAEAGGGLLAEAGSEIGREVLLALPSRPAGAPDRAAAEAVVAGTAASMGRSMPESGVAALLARNLEHPRWQDVAERCLACGNCTMVCPTCFCTTVEDTSALAGDEFERTRRWESCFTADFSYVHGGSVRSSTRSRYRQWMTHKLSTWHDQFGSSGCVGCGRCITWCPVGIDITEEVRAIAAADGGVRGAGD